MRTRIKPAPNGERRVALIIGNAKYDAQTPLVTPPTDGAELAATLRRIGFASVIEKYDLTAVEMRKTLIEFNEVAATADWAVIYYAGHAMQREGKNYLVPVDAKLKKVFNIPLETVDLQSLLNSTNGAKVARIVILDACRDNPFAPKIEKTDPLFRGGSLKRGLARVTPSANTFVFYATEEDQEAADGETGSSPLAAALLKHLETPGLEARVLFDVVSETVVKETNNGQRPVHYGSLPGRPLFFTAAP